MKFKSTTLTVALALMLSLTGCNTDSESNSTSTSESNSTDTSVIESGNSSTDTSSDSSDSKPAVGSEITTKFELPNGNSVDFTNAVVTGSDGEISLSEMTDDNWGYVTCDFICLANSLGISYNSVDNADIFDKDEMTFKDVPQTVKYEYKTYKVGDSFGGLKVTEAKTNFFPYFASSTPKYFGGGNVKFEGEVTLTGRCRISPQAEGYLAAHDIQFIPDANSLLPIMNYSFDENENVPLSLGMEDDVWWLNEYSLAIFLGNADNYPNLYFGDVPEDGSFVNVEVTIDNIDFRNELNFTSRYNAKLVDIEVID